MWIMHFLEMYYSYPKETFLKGIYALLKVCWFDTNLGYGRGMVRGLQNIINPSVVLDESCHNRYTVIHLGVQEIDSIQMLWLGIGQLLGLPRPRYSFYAHLHFPGFFDDGATQIKQKQGRAWNLVALLVIKPVLQNNWSHFKHNKKHIVKIWPLY